MRYSFIAIMIAVFALTAAPASAQVSRLSWLAGCWEQTTGDRIIEEQWMIPRAGLMPGQNRTVRNGKAAYELMRIFERGDSVVFAATIPNQPTVEFTSPGETNGGITFANSAHDFPQRVKYWIGAPDSLFARIEGTVNGEEQAVDFRFARARCTAD